VVFRALLRSFFSQKRRQFPHHAATNFQSSSTVIRSWSHVLATRAHCCSTFESSAYLSGQNLLTFRVIYQVGTPSCRELGVVTGLLLRLRRIFSLGTGERHSIYTPQAPVTSKAMSRARRTGRTYSIMQTLLMSTWEPYAALPSGVGQLATNAA